MQENLNKALSVVNRFVSSKPQMPVLSNILLTTDKGRLKLSASDLEKGVNLWVGAKIEKEGSILIPARVFTELVHGLPLEKVKLVAAGTSLKVTCGAYKAEMVGMEAGEFPEIQSVNKKKTGSEFLLRPVDFIEASKMVGFCAATDETRAELTGVLFEFLSNKGLRLAATDGYRLGIKTIKDKKIKKESLKIKNNGEGSLIIPVRVLEEAARVLDERGKDKEKESEEFLRVVVDSETNQVIFDLEDIEIASRLIEGDFPNFDKIVPQEHKTRLVLKREEFLQAVRMAAIFARDAANITKLKIKNEKLKISANAAAVGSNTATIDVGQEGEDNSIAFNYRYLLEFLNNLDSEEIVFEMTEGLSPGVFKVPDDLDYLHIIMPVRVAEEEG